MPGAGTPVHLQIEKSDCLKKSADFGTHHIYVTKQKDTEPRLAHAVAGKLSVLVWCVRIDDRVNFSTV